MKFLSALIVGVSIFSVVHTGRAMAGDGQWTGLTQCFVNGRWVTVRGNCPAPSGGGGTSSGSGGGTGAAGGCRRNVRPASAGGAGAHDGHGAAVRRFTGRGVRPGPGGRLRQGEGRVRPPARSAVHRVGNGDVVVDVMSHLAEWEGQVNLKFDRNGVVEVRDSYPSVMECLGR